MKFTAYGELIECEKAIKGANYIHVYNNGVCDMAFDGISNFDGYELIDGEWSMPEATDFERVEAQTLYTALMTDTLIEEDI